MSSSMRLLSLATRGSAAGIRLNSGLSHQSIQIIRSLTMVNKCGINSNIILRPSNIPILASIKPVLVSHAYSTKTTASSPPPPPPPSDNSTPHDKNAKGKVILKRASRAFTFSLSSLIVLGGTGIALLVVYLILSELLLPSGDTRTFNKAVKLVEKNELAQKLLDFKKGDRLKAYGEVAGDRWVRNRPVQSIRTKAKDGKDHLVMKFHVESDNGKHGRVTLEQIDTSFWSSEFAYISLEVAGGKRIYIIEPKFQSKNYVPPVSNSTGFLGLKWGPKRDN
ncbi:TIM21-domain-containing protein [Scheffersomyces amazonensis]|uniref:TIM21-domain-containing protein n=1 Tax=Scheffersomyces amazonensis TaxID=1078765 RepID=UPI00315D98B8